MNPLLPLSYGADNHGMICAYAFQNAERIELYADDIEPWLKNTQQQGFVWLHMNLGHANSETWLREQLSVKDEFFEAVREGVRSTHIERVDDTLVAVINDVLFDYAFDSSDIATLWVYVSSNVVITARTKPLRSIDRLRIAVKQGEVLSSPVHLLAHLLEDQADVLTNIVRAMANQTNHIEDEILANRWDDKRNQMGSMRRFLVRLQRLLALEPSAMFRLLNRPPNWITDVDKQELRQATEDFDTVIRDIQALQERIKLLQEEIAAQINEQNNGSLYILTVVSVLALPINIIAGLFGMNVGGIPMSDNPRGFWMIVTLIMTFTLVALYWLLIRRRSKH